VWVWEKENKGIRKEKYNLVIKNLVFTVHKIIF